MTPDRKGLIFRYDDGRLNEHQNTKLYFIWPQCGEMFFCRHGKFIEIAARNADVAKIVVTTMQTRQCSFFSL